MDGYPKTAACACGALTATAKASPSKVHACSCLECQRRSGSAFTYTAFFADADVTIAGEYRTWRRDSEAGRFHETSFCPTCGCAMFYRLEALPGVIGVPVGSFGRSGVHAARQTLLDGAAPRMAHNLRRCIALIERQSNQNR